MAYLFMVALLALLEHNLVLGSQKYWERSMTLLIAQGQEDCYFLPNVKAKQNVEIEFQV